MDNKKYLKVMFGTTSVGDSEFTYKIGEVKYFSFFAVINKNG